MKIFTTLNLKSALSGIALTLFSISASAQCDPPTGPVVISNIQSNSVTASWGASAEDPTGIEYDWEARTSGVGGSGSTGLAQSGSTVNGLLSASIGNLAFDEDYIVYVSYQCGTEEHSTWIASASFATNTLQTPTTTPATNVSDVAMRVNWTAVPGASHYLLDVSVDNFATFLPGYENLSTTLNYADLTGLSANTEYFWRVRAVGTGGLGEVTTGYSNTTSRQTLGPASTWVTWVSPGVWQPAITNGPDDTMDVIIDYDYDTDTYSDFVGKNLQINDGYTLTINPGGIVRITGVIQNLNEDNEGLVVESSGMLLQSHGGINGNTGGSVVKRESSNIYRLDYTMWSSPTSADGNVVNGQTLLQFSPETVASRFYTYNSSTDEFNTISASNQFQPGEGYLIRAPNNHPAYNETTPAPGTSWTGEFWGTPNSGNYSVALDLAGEGFNMIGNPYPSLLSLELFLAENTNLEGTVYFWRRRNNDSGADANDVSAYYATYTAAGGAAATPSDSSDPIVPDGFVQTGQGFIVQAAEAATAPTEVVFTNAMRGADTAFSSPFFRGAASNDVDEKDRFWLNVGNTTKMYNQMLIAYMPTAVNGLDRADGKSYGESSVALTSFLNGEEYVIQGRASFDNTDIVPLNFRSATAGSYTITLHDVEGVFADGQDIFLRDNVTATVHDLNSGDYTFATEAGNFNNRFEILYANPLSVANPVFDANGVIAIKQGGNIVVNAGNITIASVKVFDIRGSLIAEKNNVNASEVSINAGTTKQVLIVQVTSDDNRTVSKKVIN